MSRIAVMGSAFNPPSLGHKDVIEQALQYCDQVVMPGEKAWRPMLCAVRWLSSL